MDINISNLTDAHLSLSCLTSLSPTASSQPCDYVSRYIVVKNSWRGKYTRVFCIGANGITTTHPQTLFQVTNDFPYLTGFINISPDPDSTVQFSIFVKTTPNASVSKMSFTCTSKEDRADLLTDVERFREKFDPTHARQLASCTFAAQKYRADHLYHPINLRVNSFAVEQLSLSTGAVLGAYVFTQITGLGSIQGDPHTLVMVTGGKGARRLHRFQGPALQVLADRLTLHTSRFIGLPPPFPLGAFSPAEFDATRLGIRTDALEPAVDFRVSKLSRRHPGIPLYRLLGTTPQGLLVERDTGSYDCRSARPLASVLALLRFPTMEQLLGVVFAAPDTVKIYSCPLRDSLLAHLLEACRAAGNTRVCVRRDGVDRGRRFVPLCMAVPEEIEKILLIYLNEPDKINNSSSALLTAVEFFNANIDYNGLSWSENKDSVFSENREKLIFQAVKSLLCRFPHTSVSVELEQLFHALRRLTLSKAGFGVIALVPTLAKEVEKRVEHALQLQDASLTHSVLEFLNTLMTPHHNNYEIKHEMINKNRIMGSESFSDALILLLKKSIHSEGPSLVVLSLLNFFEYLLCPPYSETTDPGIFELNMCKMVRFVGKGLFDLLAHPCDTIRYAAGRLIRVSMEEGNDANFEFMQEASLSEGGFLHEFNVAAFGQNRRSRDLARRLLGYWAFKNTPMQDLLRRMIPVTLLRFLQSSEEPPQDEMELVPQKEVHPMTDAYREAKSGFFQRSFYPQNGGTCAGGAMAIDSGAENGSQMRLRSRSVRPSTGLNWTLFFYQIKQNHMRPDLIWNQTTRNELSNAIEAELTAFCSGHSFHSKQAVAWNHQEFEVVYHSLAEEVKIGQHYPRLLFENPNSIIARPKEFFDDLYHHFLLEERLPEKLEALRGMAQLYKLHEMAIGGLSDFSHFVRILRSTTEPLFRDRLLLFFSEALKARHNVKLFLDADGLESLVELVTLANLDFDRPPMRTATNAIAPGNSMEAPRGKEKEWYYEKGRSKSELVSFLRLSELYVMGEIQDTTRVWAQGMSEWKQLREVPQLRWGILCEEMPSILSYTAVTCTVLDIFQYICDQYPSRNSSGAIMQPLPRVKRFLSSTTVLPYIVQLLLTFDSAVCERVNRLLYSIMEDNPLMSYLFFTGYYYFSLVYTASDVLPFSRMLDLTHHHQSIVYHVNSGAVTQKSVLAPLLPQAMVCFLENHGPERFAEVFLGEYETPEIIWGESMRLHLACKITAHIADFLPRLFSNNTLVYEYCPIGNIMYQQLGQELFCTNYYLRHLCDTQRYHNWPIRDHVAFLRDLLTAWRDELNKKQCSLSREACLNTLELAPSGETVIPPKIRKAFFELSMRYHPDKNPNGQERFQAIHEAYTFLMNDTAYSDKPDPHNINLILQSQCILFKRCAENLKTYKYAGYELLFKLLRTELDDCEMLRKPVLLVLSAIELCRLTVENAPLNADELRAEGGIPLLGELTSRCFDFITPNARPDAVHVRAAVHCMWTFAAVAQFEDCQRGIREVSGLSELTAKGVTYENVLELSRACIQACEAQCRDPELQSRLITAGAPWYLLRILLWYDPTLERAGVELEESHHIQLSRNHMAVLAMRVLCALAGYAPDTSYFATKPDDAVRRLLTRLLPPYLLNIITTVPGREIEVISYLNEHSENPQFYWNHTCRAELEELLEENSNRCLRGEISGYDAISLLCDGDFSYTLHKNEIQVGGIFLRIYKAQPEFYIEDHVAFFSALITDLKACLFNTASLSRLSLIVTSLKYFLQGHFHKIEKISEQHVVVLVELLDISFHAEILLPALNLLEHLMDLEYFTESICRVRFVISRLTILLGSPAEVEVHKSSLQFLMRLLAYRPMVQDVMDCGMYLVLLLQYATSSAKEIREMSCVCLGKALCNKLVGPKLYLICAQYLPQIFIDVIKDTNPAQACTMLDAREQTPELIWNEDRRERFVQRVSMLRDYIVRMLTQDLLRTWRPPIELDVAEKTQAEEIQVGGVFLALYVQSPMWQVRKPKEFLLALLDRYVEVGQRAQGVSDLSPDSAHLLELLTQSGMHLLSSSNDLKYYCSSLGYIHKLVSFLTSPSEVLATSALRWLNELWTSTECLEATMPVDAIGPLLKLSAQHPAAEPLFLDALARYITSSSPRFGVLALAARYDLVGRLLQQLKDGETTGNESQETPAATRARITKVIKAMVNLRDPIYGADVENELRQSPVWGKYKDQSHDLFLPSTHSDGKAGGRLIGSVSGASTLPSQHQTAAEALSLTFSAQEQRNRATEPPPLAKGK
ncbi:unnamed protein product [Phytomonas sp. Hart1]|nr:unnamed protein product [Phytomonas sp. Hart1]|eukprot:CCW68090.1 unnamed protein product [Phytomonas sp. isolate Hart1]